MKPYARFYTHEIGAAGWAFVYEFALPGLLNPAHGWIPYAPVHWLGLAALGCLVLRWRWAAAGCVAIAAAYILVIASAGIPPGWEFPARYLVSIVPLIAVPIALVLREVRAAMFVFVPLFALSLLFVVSAVAQPLRLLPLDDKSRVVGARATSDLFPITNPWLFQYPTSLVVPPGEYGPSTGAVEDGIAVAHPEDGPGSLIFGPYQTMRRGDYRATFPLAASGAPPDSIVAAVDILSSPPVEVLASRPVTAGQLDPRRMTEIPLEFSNSRGGQLETRVHYVGVGTVRAGTIRVSPVDVTAAPSGRLPDWPTAFAWVLGTVAAGWVLVVAMKRARRRAAPSGVV